MYSRSLIQLKTWQAIETVRRTILEYISGTYKATIDQWSTNDFDCEFKEPDGTCHNQYNHFLFQVGDAWTLVDTQNLNDIRWICHGEPGCEYDGSLIGMNEIAVRVLQAWQPSGNGFVTFNGYSDKWGNPKVGLYRYFSRLCAVHSGTCAGWCSGNPIR